MNLSSNDGPVKERIWMDTNPKSSNQGYFAVSKFMIRLLRHDASIPREDDAAVRRDDLTEKFKVKFVGTQWTVDDWDDCLAKGRGEKKRFQYCLSPYSSDTVLYFRAIQGN